MRSTTNGYKGFSRVRRCTQCGAATQTRFVLAGRLNPQGRHNVRISGVHPEAMIGASGGWGLKSHTRTLRGFPVTRTRISPPRRVCPQRRVGAHASAASVREDLPRQVPDQDGAPDAAPVASGVSTKPPSLGTAVAFAQVRSLPCQVRACASSHTGAPCDIYTQCCCAVPTLAQD